MSADAAPSRSAPDAWLDQHGDALYRYVLTRVRDAASAEDLVQETLLAALTAQRDFRGDAAERTWLIGILRHKLADHHRRRCREQPLAVDAEGDAVVDACFAADGHWRRTPGRWAVDAAALHERKEFWQVFASCRGALPERQAVVFTRRLLEEAEPEAICQDLGLSAANLWVLLHRARLRLRECLERHWFGTEGVP